MEYGRGEWNINFVSSEISYELMILPFISLFSSIDTRVYPVDIPLFAVTVLDYVRLI